MGAKLVLFECGIAMVSGIAALAIIFCRDLDTLGLGENKASTLGVTVNKVQISVLVLAVALSTTAVAICGPIAFFRLGCSASCPSFSRRQTSHPITGSLDYWRPLITTFGYFGAGNLTHQLNYQRVF